jgi:hypothetical protein
MCSKNSLIISLAGRLTALALYLLTGSLAQSQVNLALSGGLSGPVAQEGVADFSDTAFHRTNSYGAGVGYRFGNGMTIAVRYEQLRMNLTEGAADLGSLNMRPAIASIGYQSKPSSGRGFAGHVQGGGGIARTNFVTGTSIRDLERAYGAQMVVATKTAPVFEFGGGLDYFVSKNLSFTTDFRFLGSNVGTSWTAVGYNQTIPIDGIDKFFASTGQMLGGIRFWLW